jgi:uncharacterized protein YcfL
MKKIIFITLALSLTGCSSKEAHVSEMAQEVCGSVRELAEYVFVARQEGISESEMLKNIHSQPKSGVYGETLEMVEATVKGAFQQPKVPEQQWKKLADEYAEIQFQSCLKRY